MNIENCVNIFIDNKLRFKYLNNDIKKLFISYILIDPQTATDIYRKYKNKSIKKSEKNWMDVGYKIFIYQNFELWQRLWSKYISSKLPTKNNNLSGLKELKMAYKNAFDMMFQKDINYTSKEYETNDILYKNTNIIKKINNMISNNLDIDENLFDELVYPDQTMNYKTVLIKIIMSRNNKYTKYINKLVYMGANVHCDNDLALRCCPSFEIIKILLDNGMNFDNYKNFGPEEKDNIFLHIINSDDDKYVKKLIDAGANVNYGDCKYLKIAKSYKITEMLVNNGAIIKDIDHLFMINDNFGAVKYFIEKGANVNFIDFRGNTKLMLTCNIKIAEMLVNMGLNVNQTNYSGQSALMNKVDNPEIAKIDIIEFLIKNGADVNAIDSYFKSVLRYFIKAEFNHNIICLLKQNGALYVPNFSNKNIKYIPIIYPNNTSQ